jgi:tRNA 2-selenouridine synthase
VPKAPVLIDPSHVFPVGGGRRAFQLLDVRAPVEVQRCGIPGSVALPILNDEERAAVGICYREQGQPAAIALGIELTAPHREARIAAWRDAVASSDRPTAFACWRGGQRSGIASQWLGDAKVSRVQGGTKALRRYLMAGLESQFASTRVLVISGLTGCGKTDLLHELLKVAPPDVLALDLEGLANHRGSAFGAMPAGQPSQQTFENELAATVHLAAPRVTLIEDEARYVGRLELPEYVYTTAKLAPVVMLEAPHTERVARIAREYVFEPSKLSSRSEIRAGLEVNLHKLAKRLGGVRMTECLAALTFADHEERWFSVEAHKPWIDILLLHYYDKFYESAMTRMARPVAFRGSADEVLAWFAAKGY